MSNYKLKSERGVSGEISRKTLVKTLNLLRKCQTISRYYVIDGDEEVRADEWARRNLAYVS